MFLQSMPNFVVPVIVTGALGGIGAIAVWGIHTVRRIETDLIPPMASKLDRIVAALYGPPEAKDGSGLVHDVKEVQDKQQDHWQVIRAQIEAASDMDQRLRDVEQTCAITHRQMPPR